VLVVTGPCVLAGAFLVKSDPKEHSQWNMLSHTALSAAALSNMISCCCAAYIVLETVSRRGDELAKPRPEHAAVAELTRQGEHRAAMYEDISNWHHLSNPWRALIGLATALHLVAGFIFTMASEACFRDFSISSSIEKDLPDGNPFKVVKEPFGWIPIGIFFAATLLHITFLKCMAYLTTVRLRRPDDGDCHVDDPPAYDGDDVGDSHGHDDGDFHDDDPPAYDGHRQDPENKWYVGDKYF